MSIRKLNPKKTLAILVGVSKYDNWTNIEPAIQNVTSLAAMLAKKEVFGLPETNIETVKEGSSAEVMAAVIRLIEGVDRNKFETLIFYFAGHGYRRVDRSYFLVAKDTNKQLVNANGSTGIDWDFIKATLRKSNIPQRIILLDTCYSGLAAMGEEEVNEIKDLDGGFLIASSAGDKVSFYDKEAKHTFFTGCLLDILEHGLPTEKAEISLESLFLALKKEVPKRSVKMLPQKMSNLGISDADFHFCKNVRFDKGAMLRKEVSSLITAGMALMANFDFALANKEFNLALRKARPARDFGTKIDEIHAQMDACDAQQRLVEELMVKLEADFEKKRAAEKALWKNQEEGLKAEIHRGKIKLGMAERKLADALSDAGAAHEAEIENLKRKLDRVEKKFKDGARKEVEALQTELDLLKGKLLKSANEVAQLKKKLAGNQGMGLPATQKDGKSEAKPALLGPTPEVNELLEWEGFSQAIGNYKFQMKRVAGGDFLMGQVGSIFDAEKPAHFVQVDDFYMAEFLVTQELWWRVMETKPSYFKGAMLPVEQVSWNEVQVFLMVLNAKTGRKFRLPTEAEWEFAARGGVDGKKDLRFMYSGSNQLYSVAWFNDNSDGKTHAVGKGKRANGLGLYDMSGNVWELCQDAWHPNYTGAPKTGKAWLSKGMDSIVIRGGSWSSTAICCRNTYREQIAPEASTIKLGFRLAHDV